MLWLLDRGSFFEPVATSGRAPGARLRSLVVGSPFSATVLQCVALDIRFAATVSQETDITTCGKGLRRTSQDVISGWIAQNRLTGFQHGADHSVCSANG